MDDLRIEDIHLNLELETSIKLIKIGLREYQNISMENDFYYVPFQLLSSGIERLMKCYFCLGYFKENKKFPVNKILKNLGHGLDDLKSEILGHYFKSDSKALEADKVYLESDIELNKIIDMLSEFGKYARYYNFNIITSSQKPGRCVNDEWSEFEMDVNKSLRGEGSSFNLLEVQKYIIKKIEQFIRALCRQFTMSELSPKARQLDSYYKSFLNISDSELGEKKY